MKEVVSYRIWYQYYSSTYNNVRPAIVGSMLQSSQVCMQSPQVCMDPIWDRV
jgi:hypothetical protein